MQTPQYKLDSLDALRNIPINFATAPTPQLLDNLTSMTQTAEPAVVSHYNVQPVIDVYANVQGRDLGGAASDIARITAAAEKQLPHGSTLVTRGQVSTMRSSFIGLIGGLAFAIALVYLLIVVNFQSWTEAFIVIAALPGALAGIACVFSRAKLSRRPLPSMIQRRPSKLPRIVTPADWSVIWTWFTPRRPCWRISVYSPRSVASEWSRQSF